MRNSRQNRHRSNRSNAYSESKSSNLRPFDPYFSEWALIRADRSPTATITLSETLQIDVYERPVHDSFVRPFTIADLERTLKSIPERFLIGLKRIVLFGGTKKQALTADRMFRDGQYYPEDRRGGMIVLYPFPEKKMKYFCCRLSPHQLQEFRWAGAKIIQENNDTFARFDLESLKTYYLRIVLIHEIGHHVDWIRKKSGRGKLTEEFADWFVGEYGFSRCGRSR